MDFALGDLAAFFSDAQETEGWLYKIPAKRGSFLLWSPGECYCSGLEHNDSPELKHGEILAYAVVQ